MSQVIKEMISEQQIRERVSQLGKQISEDYAGKKLHCIGVLKGSFVFMADLLREITIPVTCDFLTISSYGDLTESSGVVKILTDLTVPIERRPVLVIEDIVDTGLTLHYLLENLRTRDPASIRIASLLHKPVNEQKHVEIDYLGFEVENKFVVGYGLDASQYERNLRYIGYVEKTD